MDLVLQEALQCDDDDESFPYGNALVCCSYQTMTCLCMVCALKLKSPNYNSGNVFIFQLYMDHLLTQYGLWSKNDHAAEEKEEKRFIEDLCKMQILVYLFDFFHL